MQAAQARPASPRPSAEEPSRHGPLLPVLLAALVAVAGPARSQEGAAVRVNITYQDARPILDGAPEAYRPDDFKTLSPADRERVWPAWVSGRDAAIRARLLRGDEDSLLNFVLFGTTFTRLPRAVNDSAALGGQDRAAAIIRGRIDDMAAGILSPGENERLQFARQIVVRSGLSLAAADGAEPVRTYLRRLMARVVGDVQGYVRDLQAAKRLDNPGAEFTARSRLFRTRGLSSDTSVRPDFAVDEALTMLASGPTSPGHVRRVAIVGPGLDFTDKAEGYDYYPQQTLQPFALVDSLLRHGLSRADDLRVTTFDLSPRINQHLEAARRRAGDGTPYTLELVRDAAEWTAPLLDYWRRLGDRVGESVAATPPPQGAGVVEARAVRVRPDIVRAIIPQDLNIVLQRLDGLRDHERFDLVVATNIFVYYDVFEQALGLHNVAAMLRPGGVLLSNSALPERLVPSMAPAGSVAVRYTNRTDDGDRIVWYQRR